MYILVNFRYAYAHSISRAGFSHLQTGVVQRQAELLARSLDRHTALVHVEHGAREGESARGAVSGSFVDHRRVSPLVRAHFKVVALLHDLERARRVKNRDVEATVEHAYTLRPRF